MKYITIIALLLIAAACTEKDEQFCSCMEAGEAFNDAAAELLKLDPAEVSEEKNREFQELKQQKETACADYETMSGEEMLKRKAACE